MKKQIKDLLAKQTGEGDKWVLKSLENYRALNSARTEVELRRGKEIHTFGEWFPAGNAEKKAKAELKIFSQISQLIGL